VRVRARIEGIVQGVGFRPHVHRLAVELRLRGFVRNDAGGVVVEVEGSAAEVQQFLDRLPAEAPPLAAIRHLSTEPITLAGDHAFVIEPSEPGSAPTALVAPDTATCEACLGELFDPADRRFRYPFINCTNCGPRFTIGRGVPYDRPLTTMADFEMCGPCRAEYEDPADRRFHAQPNACSACGPTVRLVDATGAPLHCHPAAEERRGGRAEGLGGGAPGDAAGMSAPECRPAPPRQETAGGAADEVRAAALALLDGAVVAIKGLGGFHLACRADDERAVTALRSRKHREDKPFALMVPDLAAARALVFLDEAEEALLGARERPIVLARRRTGANVAGAVAPGHRDLGVMLPYSPLHHLLLAECGTALVMTSGNVSDEPIAYRDEDALERLAGIADLFLLHDRPIQTRTDDSVMRVVDIAGERRPLMLRRSRGYVPVPIELPLPAARPLLACGAHLKNTFCLVRDRHAYVGHHIGDLENYETLRSFQEGIAHFERLFAIVPEIAAHDLHPDYLSTSYVLKRAELEPLPVQHHHAHLAACLAEHAETGPAIGAIFDGTGYGTDATLWGGEILLGDLSGFERVGHLWPVRMPGGAAAIREPWRMACAWLAEVHGPSPALPAQLAGTVDLARWEAVGALLRSGTASPLTTSIGRLCDAMAALCGLRSRVRYEGQAAIELEMAADTDEEASYPLPVLRRDPLAAGSASGNEAGIGRVAGNGGLLLDARELIRAVCADLDSRVAVGTVAARFHNGLADATVAACAVAAERHRVGLIVLSGGVFQNVWLLERTAAGLARLGLRVLIPERLPPNDGGVSFGQAAIAVARAGSTSPTASG
jgi:hydrogenase maturation protein HypF